MAHVSVEVPAELVETIRETVLQQGAEEVLALDALLRSLDR
jgi:hypothetical protein